MKAKCKHKQTTETELVILDSRPSGSFVILRQAVLYSQCDKCQTELNEYVSGGYLYGKHK